MSDYTDYLAEHIDKNIAYVEYIAESINSNIQYKDIKGTSGVSGYSGTSGVSGVSGTHGYSGSSANKGIEIREKELPKMLEDFRIIEKNKPASTDWKEEYFPSFHMINE